MIGDEGLYVLENGIVEVGEGRNEREVKNLKRYSNLPLFFCVGGRIAVVVCDL